MSWLLNGIYACLLVAAGPWLGWGWWRAGKYREGWRVRLWGLTPDRSGDPRPCAWFHGVSVGEISLLAPIIRQFATLHPDWCIVVSSTTRTGLELARTKYPDLQVFYCPLDFSWSVSQALVRLRPSLLALAELEVWPNLIRGAKRSGCRVAIVNGRLSERSHRRYRWVSWFFRNLLAEVDLIAAQSPMHATRFVDLLGSATTVQVTGSVKFDGVETNRLNPRTRHLGELARIASDEVVFLAGSTQEPEELMAVQAFEQLERQYPRLRLVLVPRHIHRCQDLGRVLSARGISWELRSTLETHGHRSDTRVLLVDTIGELGAWWGLAQIAFVGGSFGARGGQNMIEPAAYGAAVSFGPRTANFREVVELLLSGDGARVVHDQAELTQFVADFLADPVGRDQLGSRARALVLAERGAVARTVDGLSRLVTDRTSQLQRVAA